MRDHNAAISLEINHRFAPVIFLLALKRPGHRLTGRLGLYSSKQYNVHSRGLKEYDSSSSGASLCVSPFLFSHSPHLREHADQCSPLFPLKGGALSLKSPLLFIPTLGNPHEGLHLPPPQLRPQPLPATAAMFMSLCPGRTD